MNASSCMHASGARDHTQQASVRGSREDPSGWQWLTCCRTLVLCVVSCFHTIHMYSDHRTVDIKNVANNCDDVEGSGLA